MPFTHTIRPRYAEIDLQGVVFNAHWLTFFDDASARFFERLGFDPKETFSGGGAFDAMVVRAVLDWNGSAEYDDPVDIAVTADRLGTKSFDLRFVATVREQMACEGVITYVCVEHGTKRSVEIPEQLRAKLSATGLG